MQDASTLHAVFVDDTDGGIEYNGSQGNWQAETNVTRLYSAPVGPLDKPMVPLYNTVHDAEGVGTSGAVISYVFNGTFLSAHFVDALAVKPSMLDPLSTCPIKCTLDGKPLQVTVTSYKTLANSITCLPGNQSSEWQEGIHKFEVFAVNDYQNFTLGWAFDGLFYSPQDFTNASDFHWDLVYTIQQNLSMAGDTFTFQFQGHSMGLYAAPTHGVDSNSLPANLTFSVDSGPRTSRVVDEGTQNIPFKDYLLIQTQNYSYGIHDFHLELNNGNVSNPVLVPLQYVIVQDLRDSFNFTQNLPGQLIAVPPPLNSSAITTPSTGHHTSSTIILVAVSLSVTLVFLFLGAVFIRRLWLKRIRSNEHTAPNASGIVLPFVERPSILRLTFDAVDSKNRRRMGIANGVEPAGRTGKRVRNEHPREQMASLASVRSRVPAPSPAPPLPLQEMELTTTPMAQAPAIAPTQPTYRIHEDAGSVRSTTPVPQEEVIDLPPNYSSILGRFRRASRTEGGARNGEGNGSDVAQECSAVDERGVGEVN